MEHTKHKQQKTSRDRWKEEANVILDTESGVKINRKALLLGYASKFLTRSPSTSWVWSYAVNAIQLNVRLWTKKEAEWNEMENRKTKKKRLLSLN